MYTAISILVFIICILLILIVLVQNSKGGGLASSFASSNQIMGVRKTTNFLEKATWTLAGAMMALCVLAVFFIPKGENASQSAIQKQLESQPVQQAIPSFPVMNNEETAPAENAVPASEENAVSATGENAVSAPAENTESGTDAE